MTKYHEARRRHTKRIFKEYDDAHTLVKKFLADNNAPPNILDAFKKISNKPNI